MTTQAIQKDDQLYRNPREYDPLRFARLKTIAEAESKDGPSAGMNLDAAQPSDKYVVYLHDKPTDTDSQFRPSVRYSTA